MHLRISIKLDNIVSINLVTKVISSTFRMFTATGKISVLACLIALDTLPYNFALSIIVNPFESFFRAS